MSEKANNKKRNYAIAKVVVALCVVLCIVLTVFEMGFTYRAIKALEVDGTEYSVAEYNWLYTNGVMEVYNSYYQTYGSLAAYFFNPQNPLDEQEYAEGMTWDDYIKEYARTSAITMTSLYNEAVANGYELPEEYYAHIDAEWEALKHTAEESGYNVNTYVELSYGRGVNEKVFRDMYELYYTAFVYAKGVRDGEEVSDADIDAYYEEHKDEFDSVNYKYYFADGSAAEGEDAAAAMDEAQAEANAVLNGATEVEFTEAKYSVIGSINSLYSEWLFDEARVSGDKEIFESETGYYVVEFVEKNDLHYNTVNVRHILVAPEDTSNETAWQVALSAAEEYKAEFEELGGTEEAFAEVAMEHSVDEGSYANGGLYENIYKGQMVEEFEAWCFDSARKPGDVEIIKTSYGYHVMYFSGEAETFYTYAGTEGVRDARYSDYIGALTEEKVANELMGIKFGGKHYN
ncbi:MAG: peptidylprolyl isomerase [Oscillospiraceae bacterium]|nr:peptidylprolyl isomerase [Oscillospiraceae bacterium]